MPDEVAGRAVAGRGADEITGYSRTRLPCPAPAFDAGEAHGFDMVLADRFIDRLAALDAHAVLDHRIGERIGAGIAAQIDDGCDLDARLQQIERQFIAMIVRRGDHAACSRSDRIEAHEPLRGRGQHDARQVVVPEHHRLLERAGRQDHMTRADLMQAISPDHRQPVVGEGACAGRRGHDLDIGTRLDPGDQLLAHPPGLPAASPETRIGERPAKNRPFVHQQHIETVTPRFECRRHAGRAAADHHDVVKTIGLVVIAGRRVPVDLAEPGHRPDARLPMLPGALRPEERAVVEADRHEPPDLVQPGMVVLLERAPVVLPHDLESRRDRMAVCQRVRFVRELHQAIGVLTCHGEDAARTVIFEGARQHPLPRRRQCRRDHIPLEAAIGAPLEGKGDGLRAIDQQPEPRPQAATGRSVHLPRFREKRRCSAGSGHRPHAGWEV